MAECIKPRCFKSFNEINFDEWPRGERNPSVGRPVYTVATRPYAGIKACKIRKSDNPIESTPPECCSEDSC
jgi:hypothetical protein